MPLESPRPITNDSGRYAYQAIQDVNARLWQDPFTAIAQHEDQPCLDKKNCSQDQHHDIDKLGNSVDNNHKNTITIFGVMVFGDFYVEHVEWRRRTRTRYAVLSGLAVNGYAPQDAEHIGYFNPHVDDFCAANESKAKKIRFKQLKEINWAETSYAPQFANESFQEKVYREFKFPKNLVSQYPEYNSYINHKEDKHCQAIKSLPEKIPFEWFNAVNDESSVLLLWLDETAFATSSAPLETTRKLVDIIKNGNDGLKDSTFKFIGPAGSDTLQNMIKELKISSIIK